MRLLIRGTCVPSGHRPRPGRPPLAPALRRTTGSLDTATVESVLRLLDALHHDGMTLVVITHDPAVAARGRRTVTIRDGVLSDGDGDGEPNDPGAGHGRPARMGPV